jgi:hypothetical protein
MMITKDLVKEKLADVEKRYVEFMLKNLRDWRVWAEASNRMAEGEEVHVADVPEFFHTEHEWARIVLEMEDQGGFNWNDPRLGKLFEAAAQTPFYRMWGETITEISLRLAEAAGVQTLLEAGAGRANLTSIMLKKLSQRNTGLRLVATDAHEAVLENIQKLKDTYPQVQQETLLWDFNSPPPDELLQRVEAPVLIYERASLTYANFQVIENLARAADMVVLGDYFNYTGELFAYDTIFDKIGLKPLFYKDVKPLLDKCFPNQYVLDQSVTDTVHIPNISLIIAWR